MSPLALCPPPPRGAPRSRGATVSRPRRASPGRVDAQATLSRPREIWRYGLVTPLLWAAPRARPLLQLLLRGKTARCAPALERPLFGNVLFAKEKRPQRVDK